MSKNEWGRWVKTNENENLKFPLSSPPASFSDKALCGVDFSSMAHVPYSITYFRCRTVCAGVKRETSAAVVTEATVWAGPGGKSLRALRGNGGFPENCWLLCCSQAQHNSAQQSGAKQSTVPHSMFCLHHTTTTHPHTHAPSHYFSHLPDCFHYRTAWNCDRH